MRVAQELVEEYIHDFVAKKRDAERVGENVEFA